MAKKMQPVETLSDHIKKHKVVCVVWHDACSDDSWTDAKDPGAVVLAVTTGFLLSENKDGITISHTLACGDAIDKPKDDTSTCCSLTIPKGCIVGAYEVPEFWASLKSKARRKKS